MKLLLIALLLPSLGCLDHYEAIRKYQDSATAKCEATRAPEACRPAPEYPDCVKSSSPCHQ